MKTHTSMTRFTKGGYKVFRCGYCDLQYIMVGVEPQYYNAGVYGWNCNIYQYGNIVITTGYRNMRGSLIPDDLIKKYSENAKLIQKDVYCKPYDVVRRALDENMTAFINKLAEI